jgi:hypothetical protein
MSGKIIFMGIIYNFQEKEINSQSGKLIIAHIIIKY